MTALSASTEATTITITGTDVGAATGVPPPRRFREAGLDPPTVASRIRPSMTGALVRTMKTDTRTTRRALLAGLAAGMAVGPRALAAGLPEVAVTKDPTCGCCEKWVAHMRETGFTVTVTEGPVNPVKARLGVPRDLASCHTAQASGYVVEGHVPAGAIKRLLAEKPQGTGLAVSGMPVGSPGMEVDGMEPDTYEVTLFGPEGRSVFARYRGAEVA